MTVGGSGREMRHSVLDRQSGVSFVELLIALTLLLIVAAGALTTYDNAVDAVKQGEVATEQQQGVRIAFGKIGEELQMAGFNYDPDNDPDRLDEQIEAAFDTAITIRADFDGNDPVLSQVPELALAAGDFEIVPTGNDEVVTYVLGKHDGSCDDVLKYLADVDEPRDDSVGWVEVTDVCMVQNDPPYTLFRITVTNDSSANDVSFVRTVLAENIGWMRFRYLDVAGKPLNPTPDLDTTADDIGGSESNIATRAKIRRIEIDLLGLAQDTDPSWVDWKDSNPATRSYRKFQLTSEFQLRNAGMAGFEDTGGSGFGSL